MAVGAQCPHERWTLPGATLLDSRFRGNDMVKRVQGFVPAEGLGVSPKSLDPPKIGGQGFDPWSRVPGQNEPFSRAGAHMLADTTKER